MFPSDRILSIDTLMPLDYFHLAECLLLEEKNFQSPHKDAIKPTTFLAHILIFPYSSKMTLSCLTLLDFLFPILFLSSL